MREHSSLGRFVVVRCHYKCRVGSAFAGPSREVDRSCGVVASGSGDYLDLRALRHLDGHADNAETLRFRHRHALPGRTAWHEQVYSTLYLPGNQRAETVVIDRSVFLERRNKRRRATAHPVNSCCHTLVWLPSLSKSRL